MPVQDLKYHELTEKIIGCAMKVHRHFGLGFPEIVYKRALMIELGKIGPIFKQEVEKDIIYEGKLIYKRRLDLIVENIVLLELKALKEVDNGDYNQIILSTCFWNGSRIAPKLRITKSPIQTFYQFKN